MPINVNLALKPLTCKIDVKLTANNIDSHFSLAFESLDEIKGIDFIDLLYVTFRKFIDTMSELGFANIDVFPLQVRKGDQLVLMRIPRTVSVKDLHGKKVDVKKSGKSVVKGDSAEAPIYFEFSELDNADIIFRPAVSSLIDGSTRLGPQFSSAVIVRDGAMELPSIAATDADDLPLEFAYNPKPQWAGMRVHTLPIGSKSQLPKQTQSKSKSSSIEDGDDSNDHKRKRLSMESEMIDHEDKSSKKKKKKHDK